MNRARFYYGGEDAPTPRRINVGVLALIEREGNLLLELRSDCGRWGFPGGGVEPSEELEEALRREVFEETNLLVTGCKLFGVFSEPSRIVAYPDGNVFRLVSFAYRAGVEGFSSLRPSEESLDLRFFGEKELRDLDVIETAQPIIRDYLRENGGPSQ